MKCIPVYIAVFLFISCSQNPGTEIIKINMPEYPPTSQTESLRYPELSRWHVQINSQNTSLDYFTQEKEFYLEVEKNQPVSILATPITFIKSNLEIKQETQFFYPAGALYPMNWDNKNVNLTWTQGFSAELMQSLFFSTSETGISSQHMNQFLCSFNWKKLQNLIEEKSYNPWQTDRTNLLENLSYGIFSSDYLKPKNLLTIEISRLELPEKSTILSQYIPENLNIAESESLSLQKNQPSYFLINNELVGKISASSAKKVLLELLYLPIFIDDYEY